MVNQTVSSSKLSEAIDLIRSKALDKPSGWIYLNRLWHDPKTREKFFSLLVEFFKSRVTIKKNSILLCPEGIYSSFGAIPFVVMLAKETSSHLAIWKEFGDVVMTTPKLFPDIDKLPRNATVILFQDVVTNGTILRKIAPILADKNCVISHFFTIVYLEQETRELQENINLIKRYLGNHEFEFISMVTGTDIGI